MAWEVEFSDEFGAWWEGLAAAEQKSVDFTVSLLQQVGPMLRMPHSSGVEMARHAHMRELRIQQDFVPGLDLSVHFTATKIGKYEIVCTQLCGLGHYNMKAYLQVVSQDEFDQWLKGQSGQ